MYKITIEKSVGEEVGKYPSYVDTYVQLVEELDLEKVIKAINNIV